MNVRTFLWFLGQPPLYREMLRRLAWSAVTPRTRRSYRERQKLLSREWCAASVHNPDESSRELGLSGDLPSVAVLHPAAWKNAELAARTCPVRMGGPGAVDLLYHACLHLHAERVVETGVAYGWSSLAILLALEATQQGSLVSIDMPYVLRGNSRQVGCVVPDALRKRWTLVRRPDRDALPKVLQGMTPIDLAHYDSDKSERGRAFGYAMLWSALRPGGWLISDDIHDNLAFRLFSEQVSRKPVVLPGRDGSYVGILKK